MRKMQIVSAKRNGSVRPSQPRFKPNRRPVGVSNTQSDRRTQAEPDGEAHADAVESIGKLARLLAAIAYIERKEPVFFRSVHKKSHQQLLREDIDRGSVAWR